LTESAAFAELSMEIPMFRYGSSRLVRRLGALVLAVVVAACTVCLCRMASNRADTAVNAGLPPAPGETARGVRTSVVRDHHVALRASADEISVRRPRAFGPFRIGFLRAVSARGVVVETFDEGHGQPRPLDSAPAVTDSLTQLLPRSAARRVAKVEVEGVNFTRYERGAERFAMRARRCETTALPKGLLCTGGSLRTDGSETAFRKALFTDGAWRVDGRRWPADAGASPENVGDAK
jgi:hypothetical protein